MATRLSNKGFIGRHFVGVMVGLVLIVALLFVVMQYHRERELRINMLNEELEIVNQSILRNYPDLSRVALPRDNDLRITVIRRDGTVVYDNKSRAAFSENHLNRPEVKKALAEGSGCSVDRKSESNSTEYFYSATRGDSLIVRTALPYNVSLGPMLLADFWFFVFMALITTLLAIVAIREHRVALRRRDDRDRIKRQLTNNINHELKTPVASVLVCLETVLDHPDLDEAHRLTFLNRAMGEAHRLESLLADVATIARLDDGNRVIRTEPICLNDIVAEAVDEARLRPEAAHFYFDVNMPEPITMEGNASLMSSVFQNLISNAMSYSEGNEITIRHIASRRDATVIEVSDNGVGVPEEHLEHIFERFYRIDKGRSRGKGGTGLGLSIVKNAVLFHHGTIRAVNDHGLKFEIVFKRVNT